MNKFYLLLLLCFSSLMAVNAQVTDVVTGLTFPYDVALYENDLYITELGAGRIVKIDITAPAPPAIEVVLTGLLNPAAMTISGTDLYYAESNADRVSKIDLTQATPVPEVVLSTGLSTPNDMLVDGNFLYITDEGTDQLIRIDLTDETPTPEVIVSGLSNPLGIAKFGNALYLSIFGSSSVIRVDITQTPAVVTTIATGFSQPAGITVDGSFLYVAESNKVSRLDLNSATPTAEVVVTDGINGSRNVAFDGIDLYIAQTGGTFGGTGLISKLAINTPVFGTLANVCSGDMPNMLGGASPATGVYSGPGVTDNGDGTTFSFNPSVAGGPGTYTITYTLGGGSMVTSDLTVVASPDVTFSTGGLSVQVDAGVQTGLGGGTPAGGFYSGNGVTDDGNGMTYSFDPAAAGEGENVITYIFTSPENCAGVQGAVITVTPAVVPGDDCAEAIDISAQFGQEFNVPQTTGLFDNTDFTTGADDPINGIDCFYSGDPLQNSGWFSFTGDGNTYRVGNVQCTGPNDNLDLQIAVYSGTCGNLTDVACNDDNPAGGLAFLVEFPTEEGVEYLVLVDGYDGTVGEFCIEVTNLTDPNVLLPGEMCMNAIDISALTGQAEMVPQVSDIYDNTEYGTDATDPPADPTCNGSLDRSIWFNFTGDGNPYTIRSLGDSDMSANIYTGECEALTLLTCNDDDPAGGLNFLLEFETELGVNYSIIVDDRGAAGPFSLEVTNQGTTGVTDLANTEFNVFPNPTTGNVQLPQLDLERVEAYDATGRLVFAQQQPGTSINLAAQPAGLYLLKLYSGKEVYSAKVVKK